MILSAQSIRKYGMIAPFYERSEAFGMTFGLGPCGYDVRIAENIALAPQGFKLASTIELFNMPDDIVGNVKDKSSWARRGLTVQNTVIEPGWRGFLTLELTNHSDQVHWIKKGTPIAQILFEFLDQPTELPYDGKYQNQEPGPQKAR